MSETLNDQSPGGDAGLRRNKCGTASMCCFCVWITLFVIAILGNFFGLAEISKIIIFDAIALITATLLPLGVVLGFIGLFDRRSSYASAWLGLLANISILICTAVLLVVASVV